MPGGDEQAVDELNEQDVGGEACHFGFPVFHRPPQRRRWEGVGEADGGS